MSGKEPTAPAGQGSPATVFISHATADRPFVERHLIRALEAHGLRPWYCKDSIVAADKWERKILEGIRASSAFVLVMSPRSARSEWVRDELHLALSHLGDARVIPVLIETCQPEDFHIRVCRLQHLDFRQTPAGARLVRAVRALPPRQVRSPAPPPVSGRPARRVHRAAWVAAAVVLVALAVPAAWWAIRPERPAADPPAGPGSPDTVDPGAAALCDQSEAACRAGQYRDALALADRAVAAAPRHAPGYACRARARYFLGEEDGALADCDEAIRRDPNLAVAHAFRAPVAYLRRAPAAGVRDGERAGQLAPPTPEARLCLAVATLRAGDAAGAARLAKAVVDAAPQDPEAHRVHGLALAALADRTARAAFDAAVEHSGGRPFYLTARADYLVAAAQGVDEADALALAEADATRALQADPQWAPAHLARARLHARREEWAEVARACEAAVAIDGRLAAAYLRAADDLSPRMARQFQGFQDALGQPLDLRELKGGDFGAGALLTDLQRLVSNLRKQEVAVYINWDTFPADKRPTLRDAKVNLYVLMDVSGENLLTDIPFGTVLESVCRQMDAAVWVTPDYIEIIHQEAVPATSAVRRLVAPGLVPGKDLAGREQRRQALEALLEHSIDLRELKGGDFSFGSLLTDVQRLLANQAKRDVRLWIDLDSFAHADRATLSDTKVDINSLLDVSGERLLQGVKFKTFLDSLMRQAGAAYTVRPEYIEIHRPPRAAVRKLVGRPRPEAMRWLTRGIDSVPESAELYMARGRLWLERFELDAAIDDLTRAIDRNPNLTEAYRLRSVAYAVRGKRDDPARAGADALATRR